MSREALAAATHVGVRTIQRIEKGEVTDSPNAVVLEDFLGIGEDGSVAADAPVERVEDMGPPLRLATTMQLLAELHRRFADLEAKATPRKEGP